MGVLEVGGVLETEAEEAVEADVGGPDEGDGRKLGFGGEFESAGVLQNHLDIVVGKRYIGIRVLGWSEWSWTMTRGEYRKWQPMGPAALHILLALAGEELHGYGIMQEIARQGGGKYRIGPGTLYDNLKKLMNDGLVEESSRGASNRTARGREATGGERARRYYRLSGLGRDVLAAEVERLRGVVREARGRLRGLKPRRA